MSTEHLICGWYDLKWSSKNKIHTGFQKFNIVKIMPHISPVTFYIDYRLSHYYFLMCWLKMYLYTDLDFCPFSLIYIF